MATRPRRSSFRTQPSVRPSYQDFKPKSEVIENQEGRILRIQLPGFTKERIRVQYEDSSRTVNVSGERPIEGIFNRRSRFREAYPVPQNCNVDKIQSTFNMGILTITMPKKLISQAEVKATQEKAPSPPKEAEKVVPQTSTREEPRDKKSASSPSSSGTGFDDMKAQKGQEETPSQRPIDSQKPEKELRAVIPSEAIKGEKGQEEMQKLEAAREKQADGKPRKIQEETEPKLTLKLDPTKSTDKKPQEGQGEIVLEPKITKAATQEKQIGYETQKVQEETKPKPTLKLDPQKPAEEKPQKDQQKIEPETTLMIDPRKTTDEKPQKGQEETEPKPTSKVVPRKPLDEKPEKGQEEIKQTTTLTAAPGNQADEKTAGRKDEDAKKETISKKEIEEGKHSESRKPGVEQSTVTEKEIRARRELTKADELPVPKTPERKKKTTSKAGVAANEWNLNDSMIETIGKGIKEVTASASQAFTRIAEGKWDDEDKPLLLNMGVSVLVLAAVGIYAFYRFSSSERT